MAAGRPPAPRNRRAPRCAGGSRCRRGLPGRALAFELLAGDAPLGGVAAVQLHLGQQGGVGELSEPLHQLESWGASAAQGEQSSVIDQEHVVLTNVEPEAVRVQSAVTDAGQERVRLGGVPDVRGGVAQLVAEGHRHRISDQSRWASRGDRAGCGFARAGGRGSADPRGGPRYGWPRYGSESVSMWSRAPSRRTPTRSASTCAVRSVSSGSITSRMAPRWRWTRLGQIADW